MGGIDLGYNQEGEGGEAIMNKRSTAMFAPLLSSLNVMGGGDSFNGMGTQAPQSLIDYDVLAGKISQANRSLPAPRVAVDEINTTQNSVSVIESKANF